MSKNKRHKKPEIPAEKMAILAEQGLKAAKLTKKEKQYLLDEGLTELYDIWDFTAQQAIPPLESETVEAIMNRFFGQQAKVWVRICQKIIEMVEPPTGLHMGSPVFAHRGEDTKSISFHKKVEKLTIHLEIKPRDKRLADIWVRITDESDQDVSSFEVELFKGERCVETVNTTKSSTVLLSAIETGDYILRISYAKGEISSISIRIEQ